MFHSSLKLFPLALLLFVVGVGLEAAGQGKKPPLSTPSGTGRATQPSPPPRSRPRTRPRPPVTDTSTTPASTVSDELVALGDRFRKKEKWNAAEAAYKEAFNAWKGNGDALLALAYLYLEVRDLAPEQKLEKARAVHNQLRSVDSSLASTLLTEINKFKVQVNR